MAKKGEWFERKVKVERSSPAPDPERDRLLALVLAAPDALEPRLVYGDWLLERGDPRGEFISVQCELERLGGREARGARADELRIREAELHKKHKKRWVGHFAGTRTEYGIEGGQHWVKGSPTRWDFERGFVRSLTMKTGDFAANAEGIFAAEPLRQVHLTDRDPQALSTCPQLERLRELDLSRVRLKEQGASGLFQIRRFAALEVLNLNLCGLGVAATRAAIAACDPKSFPKLRELSLWENALGDNGVAALAEWPLLKGLTRLELGRNEIGEEGALALARSPHLDAVQRLTLFSNHVGEAEGELRARFGRRVLLRFEDHDTH